MNDARAKIDAAPVAEFTPAIPNIADGCVSRWLGKEPLPLVFTIAELVPQGMVTLFVSEGGSGKSLLCQTAILNNVL